MSRSQFCIEISSNDRNALFVVRNVFLNSFVHLLDVMVRISRVGELHTHQFDALAVDHDCGGDGTFVDVFSVSNSLPPLLVQHDSNAVFVVISSCPREYVFVMCLPYLCFVLPPRFTQKYCIPSVTFDLANHFFDSFT